MGEYAHDAMRQEIRSRHGFDIGEYEDEPKRSHAKPAYKRVKCQHCDAKPKEQGLWQHVRDVHGISKAGQALAKVSDKKAIAADIKAGKTVTGAMLSQGVRLVIA